MTSVLDAALAYAAQGWPVLPIYGVQHGRCTCGGLARCKPGKHPVGRLVPNGLMNATLDPAVIATWWSRCPTANVAIATGRASGLVVLDVDPAHGGDDSLADLEREHGALPETIETLTGGGGRHVLLAHPGGVVANTVGIEAGLDVRGDGGYIVAPPSVHISSRPYVWAVGCAFREIALADVPAWLLTLMRRGAGHPRLSSGAPFVITEGERNDRLHRLAGAMRRWGLSEACLVDCLGAVNRFHCMPALGAQEISAIARSAARYAPATYPSRRFRRVPKP
jgi:hypothetical protein